VNAEPHTTGDLRDPSVEQYLITACPDAELAGVMPRLVGDVSAEADCENLHKALPRKRHGPAASVITVQLDALSRCMRQMSALLIIGSSIQLSRRPQILVWQANSDRPSPDARLWRDARPTI
jgi:hypothetical protein